MQFLTWIFTAIALYGTYLNCIKDVRGFYWWIVSNTAFAVINFLICQYALTFLFSIYLMLAIKGVSEWKKVQL